MRRPATPATAREKRLPGTTRRGENRIHRTGVTVLYGLKSIRKHNGVQARATSVQSPDERTRRGLVRWVVLLRLAFGAVWLIDAYLKWQPAFIAGYAKTVADGAKGQPGWLRPWFHFWRHLVDLDPHLLAYGTAAIETLIATALILGVARRALYVAGLLWSVGIWTIPEGFGDSLLPGATDLGTAIMYALVFGALYTLETLPAMTGAWSLDRRLERRFPWWRVIGEPGARLSNT